MKKLLLAIMLLIAGTASAQEFIRNDNAATSIGGANGTISQAAVDQKGRVFVMSAAGATDIAKAEDAASASGDTGIAIMGIYRSQASNAVSTVGDYATLQVDQDGRLTINPHGAHPGEFWQSCGTATASTSDVAIKTAVPSWRIYTTSITCSSSSATTATNINFKDGATIIAVGGVSQMATTSPGTFTAVFPTPLRGTVNTALNFNTAVSVTSVVCCAAGYISVN